MERALQQAALWDEVKTAWMRQVLDSVVDNSSASVLLDLLAVEPDVLLMDEPCSALDPIATARIEDLIRELKEHYTIVMVTHNMQQAARASDKTAFLLMGSSWSSQKPPACLPAPKTNEPRITSPEKIRVIVYLSWI